MGTNHPKYTETFEQVKEQAKNLRKEETTKPERVYQA
jgi:hypothetical protein